MKAFYSALYITILLIGQIITVSASPAYPNLITMKQPNGAIISLYLKGDEKVHWMESEDGYSLLYDGNRAIVYAISDEKGDMIPSSVTARDISSRSVSDQAFLKDIPKKLFYSTAQINTFNSIWEMVQQSSNANSSQLRAAVGEIRAICTLVGFPDKPLVKGVAEFNSLMNQAGYSANGAMGSVNDYYYENSYGKLNLVITVAGPYTVSKNWAYYGANDSDGNDSIDRLHEFAAEVAKLTFNDASIHPADYDNDGDGYIDAFHIIYAGYGEESGGEPNCIWAHESGISTLTFGNKRLRVYSCSPELRGNNGSNITHIGVICHEMGHIFGAPDFYDTDGSDSGGNFSGTGSWDLMASGSWNNNGACPAYINMYEKIQLGWVSPVLLEQPQIITGMPNSAMNPVAYRYNTSTSGEYFILENRQKTGFDRYIPGTGLLIYHVSITNADINNNTVNTRHPQKVYPVCASATTNPTGTPLSYGNINSAGCPFPGISNNASFTDYTVPSATSWNGANTVKPLTEIQEQNDVISFRFSMPEAEPVTNVQLNVENQNTVQLTWNKPSEDVIGYNIYRNDLLLIKLMGKNNTSYSQINVSSGNYSYCVTAFYDNQESSPVCKEVQISNSSIDSDIPVVQNLEAQNVNDNKDIELHWQSPFVSDWMTHANSRKTWSYYPTDNNQFISAVRFTTEDLRNFQGSKLTKVRFSLYNTQCTYTIQVWLKDPGLDTSPGNPIINQVVNNPRTANDNFEVILNSPVTLAANKELWIGIKYELNPLTYVAGIDYGPIVQDRNFVFLDNRWYSVSEDDNFNWLISGYLQFDDNLLQMPADDWLRSTNAIATNYIIYRDNRKLATTNQSSYIDFQPPFGSHIYCVSIAYDDGKESEPVCVEALSSNNNTSIVPIDQGEEEINIYPNPIQKGEALIIRCDPHTGSTLSFYTISGQLILQEQITGAITHKKMNFEPGIYLLQIKNYSKTFTRKIIIK